MADLPSLVALRAFEAAARHLSFQKAAAELHVTPAALSFQIKALEEALGQALFRRLHRAVELTAAGRALAPGAREGFAALRAAWAVARRAADDPTLTVTAGPAFTAKWLAPRLFHFAARHPAVELRFVATLRLLDFDRDEVDVAVRFGRDPPRGLYSVPILEDWMTPMMTPALAARLARPADLLGQTLLHEDYPEAVPPPKGWDDWCRASGLPAPPRGGPRFSQADHVIDAALAGAGVALGRISIAEGALSEGRLVAPFPLALRMGAIYRFVCPEGAERRPKVRAFRDWLVAETALTRRHEEGRRFLGPAFG